MNNKTWHKISIENHNNQTLSTLLCLTAKDNRLIIACHGFTGSKEGSGRAVDMAEQLACSGLNTLLFDFSGCGESEGRWEDISLSGQIADLGAVVDWCRREGFGDIILNGRSFGGTTALCYAASDAEITGICTWAAVARLKDLFVKRVSNKSVFEGSSQDLIALHGEEGTVSVKRAFFYDLQKHNPLKAATRLSSCPLLLIHGSADLAVPLEDARLLYNHAREPKLLAAIEGADHRFSEHLEEVWKAFFKWLKTF